MLKERDGFAFKKGILNVLHIILYLKNIYIAITKYCLYVEGKIWFWLSTLNLMMITGICLGEELYKKIFLRK